MKSLSAAFVTASLCLSAAASADVLWDQSPLSGQGASVPNSISGSPATNGSTMYALSDIVVPAGGWTITSVSTFFSALGFQSWPNDVTIGRLNIFARTGALPVAGNNPGTGTIVNLTCTQSSFDAGPGFGEQGVNIATAAGLNIHLDAGNYWIGLTPVTAGGWDMEYNWPTSNVFGTSSALWSAFADPFGGPPAQTWLDSGVEGSILIQGVPTPGAAALLGLAGLTGMRRRRAN